MLAHLQQLQQKASKPEPGRNTYYKQSRLEAMLAHLRQLQQKASKPEPVRNITSSAGWGTCWLNCSSSSRKLASQRQAGIHTTSRAGWGPCWLTFSSSSRKPASQSRNTSRSTQIPQTKETHVATGVDQFYEFSGKEFSLLLYASALDYSWNLLGTCSSIGAHESFLRLGITLFW
jgi:hypothetical protein